MAESAQQDVCVSREDLLILISRVNDDTREFRSNLETDCIPVKRLKRTWTCPKCNDNNLDLARVQ